MINDKLTSLASPDADVTTGFAAASYIWLDATVDMGTLGGVSTGPGNIGNAGCPAWIYVSCTEAIKAAGAGSLSLLVASVGTAAAAKVDAAGSGYKVHARTGSIATDTGGTEIPAGTILWKLQLPSENDKVKYLQHLGVIVNTVGQNLTAGKIGVRMTFGVPDHTAYADGAPSDT